MNEKRVYTFGNGNAEGKADMRNLLGGKGANLAEMNLIGVPVPPGFTITTDVCNEYFEKGETCHMPLPSVPAKTDPLMLLSVFTATVFPPPAVSAVKDSERRSNRSTPPSIVPIRTLWSSSSRNDVTKLPDMSGARKA